MVGQTASGNPIPILYVGSFGYNYELQDPIPSNENMCGSVPWACQTYSGPRALALRGREVTEQCQ